LSPWIRILIRIRIEIKSWTRIRIESNADPQHCYLHIFGPPSQLKLWTAESCRQLKIKLALPIPAAFSRVFLSFSIIFSFVFLYNFHSFQAGTASTILNTMDMLNLGKKSPHVEALESLFALLRSHT
jgi:hypothetical protein